MPYLCPTRTEDPPLCEGEVLTSLMIILETRILASVHRAGNVPLYIEYLSELGLTEKKSVVDRRAYPRRLVRAKMFVGASDVLVSSGTLEDGFFFPGSATSNKKRAKMSAMITRIPWSLG